MTSKKNNIRTLITKIILTCLVFMLAFSAFNIGKVLASVDDIVIENASIIDKSSTTDASIISQNKDKLETNVTYHNVNDYVEFKLTLKNNDSKKYTIKTISDNNTNSNIVYEYDKHENEEFTSGSEKDINIKITYKTEATDKNGRDVNNNVEFTITFVDEDGNESDKVVPINPKTGDNLIIYIITGSISLLGLILILKNKKLSKSLLAILLITPFIVKAATLSYTFNFNSEVKLYDKMLVTIDINGEKEERLIPYKTKITEPDPISIPGYSFVGWYNVNNEEFDFNNNITEDTNIKAKYNLLSYDITYNLNGGVETTNPSTYTVEDNITLANPTKDYYDFIGWTGTDLSEPTKNVVIKNKIENRTYLANYIPTTYTIAYTGLTAEEIAALGNPTNYNIETSTFTLVNPTKDGYNFKGWTGSNGDTPGNVTINTGSHDNKSYKANFEAIEYDINYDLNGGTVSTSNPSKYTIESNDITLIEPTKEGYTFIGWTGTNIDTPTKNITIPKGSIGLRNYVANYSLVTYTITYSNITDAERTIINNPTEYNIESTTITLTNPSNRLDIDNNPLEDFIGWDDGNGNVSASVTIAQGSVGNKIYTAVWGDNDSEYTINYNLNGGSLTTNNPTKYKRTTDTFTLNNPSKEHYNFTGWSGTGITGTSTEVTITKGSAGNRNYVANYAPIDYTITYTGLTAEEITALGNPDKYNIETTTFTLVNPSDRLDTDGDVEYEFAGWKIGSTTSNTVTLPDTNNMGNKIYEATWNYVTPTTYTINYNLNGGTVTTNNPTEFNKLTTPFTLNNPTKTGYNFKGWSGTGLTGDENITVVVNTKTKSNLSYTANYSAKKYNVIFDGNDSSVTGTMNPQEHTYDDSLALTKNTFERTGYNFLGWNTKANGLGTHYDDEDIVTNLSTEEDVTLYAEWEEKTITVTFDSQGGSIVSAQVLTYGQTLGDVMSSLPETNKTNSVFMGWYEDLNASPIDLTYAPSDNVTLLAKWSNIICKKAITLNTETCNSPNSKGCKANGYTAGDTIYYGNVINSDTFIPGDAFDCNVDGTGYNQRFYYVTDNGDNAVLISHTTFSGANGQSNINVYYNYDTSLTLLPTTEQWSNLPVTFEIQSGDYRPARMIRLEEIMDMTGLTYNELKTDGALNDYEFLFENSLYSGIGERSTSWLEQTVINNNDTRIRYRNDSRKLDEVTPEKYNSSNNCIKPIIEVPYDLIDDSYIVTFDSQGGTIEYERKLVNKGTKINSFPTITNGTFDFAGWYTDTTWATSIDEDYIPTGYDTYYARWTTFVDKALIDSTSLLLAEGNTANIVITNLSDIEPISYTSNDTSIASVDSNGVVTGESIGETEIIITGLLSGQTRIINVEVEEEVTTYEVTFDSQGGSEVAPMTVNAGEQIGSLPADPTKENQTFDGWYTNTTYSTKVTTTTIIDSNKIFYARWIPNNAVAVIGTSDFYTSIQAAIDESTTTKTIKVLKDVSLTAAIDLSTKNTNKNIVLDLNGHTLSASTSPKINVIKNKATLEVKNGTINTNSEQGAINSEGGTVTITNMTIIANTRQAVNNEGGNVIINGLVASSNTNGAYNGITRGTVQNNSGTTTIISANITNSTGAAVSLGNGTLTVGTKDDAYDTDNIVIQGATYGIISKTNYSVYDGMIKGKTAAVEDETKITSIEDNSTKVNDSLDGYYRLYYELTPAPHYTITLDANGGSVDPSSVDVIIGEEVGTLPTPTYGTYTFEGWYTDNDEQVLSTKIPESNETYYAKWSSDGEIVTFRTTNNAMKTYYQYIDTWKDSSSNFPTWSDSNKSPSWALDQTENTPMLNNFNNNNCMCADGQCSSSGTVMCDKPEGYDTGHNEKVNVFLSDNTKVIGKKVSYSKSDNGVIYNLIPGQVYFWNLDSNPEVKGYVMATGERRILDTGDVRNTRDLGGLPVDSDGNGSIDGHLAYGRLFRGIKLSSANSVTELENLGINSELDLREANSDTNKLSRYNRIEAQNYFVDPNGVTSTERNYYAMTRAGVKFAMEEIVAGNNLYFHCRIGTDRTGTVAYVLEGLLGVPEEDRIEDYELSFFYGLVRIHRYHNEKPGSNVGTGKERFVYMHNLMPTNSDIYDWYMAGSTDPDADNALINAFRAAMIESN